MFGELFTRGFRFARENPQILYTLLLAVAIPAAFFWTSEQFLRVARENQERMEVSRVVLLTDVFATFTSERFGDVEYLERQINDIVSQNATLVGFRFVVASSSETGAYHVHASLSPPEDGQPLPFTEGNLRTIFLFDLAGSNPDSSYFSVYYEEGTRYMRTVRALRGADGEREPRGYLVIDFSMAQVDAVAAKNINNAYAVLVLIVILIVAMLARQAKIIDYATLYKRLEEVDRMKDDFVSMAAHELRSPLTVIRGYVDLLGDLSIDASGKQLLKNIDMAAQQLNALVGDILDVSKLQEGRMSFRLETIAPSEHIAMVVDSFKKPAADKGLTLTYIDTPLPKISVDPDRIRQILINLVGNAVKYTPSGSVTVKTAVLATGRVEIRVSDTGMGISAEDQKKLFQKFYRVKNVDTEKITGTGLGLWITAQIVEAMKGTITVESIRGKGSDFILTFPPA